MLQWLIAIGFFSTAKVVLQNNFWVNKQKSEISVSKSKSLGSRYQFVAKLNDLAFPHKKKVFEAIIKSNGSRPL